jgi:hypothetical protein
MTKTFTIDLTKFTVTECTVKALSDFDPNDGYPIFKRQPALLTEWENSRGVRFNAIAFHEMPQNNDEFDEMWSDPNVWTVDRETLSTVEVESN